MSVSTLFSGRIHFLLLFLFPFSGLNSQTSGTSDLPLIVIDTRGETITDGPKINVRIKVIDNGPGKSNSPSQNGTDYEGYAGIEVRGQSSQMFPKKNYSLELRNETGGDTIASLLGMPEEEDWVLYAPYSDKTLLRNAVTFHLGSRMGEWQPRNHFCEVHLNDEYIGIYALTENIKRDKNRVDISKLKPDEISGDDLTGGYILKSDKTYDLGPDDYFTIHPAIRYHNEVEYKITYVYPASDEIAPEQKTYIEKFFNDAENSINGDQFSDPVNGFRKYLDIRSFVDFQIIQELSNNVDGYRLSSYFFKDKDSKEGKLHAGPLWDFDLCYANEDYTDFNLQTDIWLYTKFADEYGGRIHWWARLMEDLSYRSVFIERWKELRKKAFSTDSIMMYIDNSISYLGEAIDRNFEKWPVIGEYVWPNYYIGETYEDEVNYLKSWITERVTWIDANITVAENVSGDYSDYEILVYPNPVKDQANIYLYLNYSEKLKIEVFDLMGRKIYEDEIIPERNGYQTFIVDVSNFASGYYVLRIIQKEKLIGRKNIIVTGD
jgi:hypothetical protein